MQMLSILAAMDPFEPRPGAVAGFFLATLVFLVLCAGVFRWGRAVASKLIALGILTAVVSVGYESFVILPTVIALSAGLMRIAVILVLGGVACIVLSALGVSLPADTAKPKEPVNVP